MLFNIFHVIPYIQEVTLFYMFYVNILNIILYQNLFRILYVILFVCLRE